MDFQQNVGASEVSNHEVQVSKPGAYGEDVTKDDDLHAARSKRIKVEIDPLEQHSVPASCEQSSDDSDQSDSSSLKTTPCATTNGYILDQPSLKIHSNGEHGIELQQENISAGTQATRDSSQVIKCLENEIEHLNSLLRSKELEWNAILKLKSLKEILVDRLKRRKDILLQLQCLPDTELDLHNITELIANEKVKVGPDKFATERSTQRYEMETEVAEQELQTIPSFPEEQHFDGFKSVDPLHLSERKASMALQELCERNRNVVSNTGGTKVIGEGRQGTVLDVRAIIAEHRVKKLAADGSVKKNITFPDPLLQSPSISYTDVLLTLAKISQHETKFNVEEPCQSISSVASSSARQTGGNILTNTNKTRNPLTSTLAKLLSSSSTPNGISRSSDSKQPAKEHSASTASQSGTFETDSLSLTSLLTMSKNRDEKIRSDEESVPLCQGCHANRAQFVCAGCGNQWYCSRDCQVSAWDEHSDVCSG